MLIKEEEGIKIHQFQGETEGPRFTVLGAIHGYEYCGPQALQKLLKYIEEGKVRIKAGSVTIVPVCNPKAYRQKVRFVESNMNRFFYPKTESEIETYEHRLQNILCPYLQETEYLLDIHSYTAKGGPFVYASGDLDSPKNVSYLKALGVPHLFFGWAEAVAASDDVADKRHAMGTTEYTREFGGIGFTVECGNHDNPKAPEYALQATLNALTFLGIAEVDAELQQPELFNEEPFFLVTKGVHMKRAEGKFAKEWKNLDYVSKGTLMGTYEGGEQVLMPEDAYLIMPKEDNPIGAEWFLWGMKEDILK